MLFSKLIHKLRFYLDSTYKRPDQADVAAKSKEEPTSKSTKRLDENLNKMQEILHNSDDIVLHRFRFGRGQGIDGALMFIDGLVNSSFISEAIMRPLVNFPIQTEQLPPSSKMLDMLSREVLCVADLDASNDLKKLAAGCLIGDVVLFLDGCQGGLFVNAKGWEKRSISEPQSETVIRGPREGFTENLRTNTSLLRRKIHNTNLCVEEMKLGRKTNTAVSLVYLDLNLGLWASFYQACWKTWGGYPRLTA